MNKITIILEQPLLLTEAQAAKSLSWSLNKFKARFNVPPVILPDGLRRYHVADISDWIEAQKNGHGTTLHEDYLGKLK